MRISDVYLLSEIDRPPSSGGPGQSPNDSSLAILFSRVLVVIALLAQIVVAWRFWALTWDDSAITLGFARSFAHTGRIEPTPGSGIVEGYSTTLWMLLMTVAAKLVSSPSALLAFAKISTLVLNLANILLIRRWFPTWSTETCANLIAGSTGCGLMFYETINGMEGPLILALVMVMLLLLPSPGRIGRLGYLLAGSALLLTRWEEAWLIVPFVLVDRTRRNAIVSAVTWFSVFLVANLVRWSYFGSILPNTILAKRGVPYIKASASLELRRHLQEPLGIIASCKVMLLLLLLFVLYDHFVLRHRKSLLQRIAQPLRDCWQLRFCVLFTVFSLAMSAAIGTNWGPPFRSFYSGWPFLFCLLLLPLAANLRGRPLFLATVILCVAALLRMSVRVRELEVVNPPDYMPGATISRVAATNTRLALIQSASHRHDLLYAGPDMGGILLYSDGIRVIDLGLLCDSILAKQRYAAIDSYVIQTRRPDIIEVHQMWTTLTKLQQSATFLSGYRPVYVDGMRFFLRRDLIAAIDPSRLSQKDFNASGHPAASDAEDASSADRGADFDLNTHFGTYLVLN